MSYKTIIIANPAAGRGLLKKSWKKLATQFGQRIKKFEVAFTEEPKDGTRLTRKALLEGYELVIGIGGDGTLNECLNGFFENEKLLNPTAILGILPFGRGSDLARSLNLSRDPQIAINNLAGQSFRKLDVGKVTFKDQNNKTKIHYFMNNAYLGLGEAVDYYSGKAPKILGASGAYLYGTLRGLFDYKPISVTYSNEKHSRTATIMNLVVANGPYFGAGMKAAPFAKVDDGLFDIVVIRTMSLPKMVTQFRRIYSGDYLKDDNIDYIQTKKIHISANENGKKIIVDMDGDSLASLPATFEILPQAIRFKL